MHMWQDWAPCPSLPHERKARKPKEVKGTIKIEIEDQSGNVESSNCYQWPAFVFKAIKQG